MALILLRDGNSLSPVGEEEASLAHFCERLDFDIKFEWINGQYWLHSDNEKERPISVEIDKELSRHEEFFKKAPFKKSFWPVPSELRVLKDQKF